MKWVILVLLLVAAVAPAATVTVTGSLARAVADARAGDTLLLNGPAVFVGPVTVDKPLRLIGTGSPVLDAGGTGAPLTINAQGVEVRGLTVRNSGIDLGGYDAGIMILSQQVTVADCRVENDAFGIYLRGAGACLISNNCIFGRTNLASAKRGNGIHLWNTKGNRLTGNVIHDKRDGIYLSYADQNLLVDNRVEQCRFGIHYMYSHHNRLQANTLTANAVGAALMFARDCVVEGNRATANRRHGILLKQVEHSRILGNTVSGQNRGLFVQEAVQDRFEGNVVAHNDVGLYFSNGSEQNVFTGNAFIANTDQVWQPPDSLERGAATANVFYEKGRGNYWSDYTGMDAVGDGVGDTPYHESDIFGRLVDRYPEARVFALSPAVALMRKGEELLPVLNTDGITDLYPLMRPPHTDVTCLTALSADKLPTPPAQ